MKTLITSILFACFTLISAHSNAQRNVSDSIIPSTWLVVQYGGCVPEGDLADRYGFMNHIGLFAGYKTQKNWVVGLDAAYMFGGQVRMAGVFDHLIDSNGNITDQNGDIAIVRTMPRGFYANGTVGKVIPVLSPNPNSGIYVNFGVGYLLHKLRVETQDHVVPQIELDYRKGYDRLTTGVNTSQFIGYTLMANDSPINFFAGFYAQQGFTYNRRTINFDSPEVPVSTDLRLDLQFGFKVGWMIPIYQRQPKDYYFD
ncbi:MAG: hypothetical protein P8P74_12485 [Crocinitomicaceae bacterium]|nr:hypothetical protein [Crocinitomicaceae bacterium]